MIEICCGSYMDAYNAHLAGVKRIELNSALSLGGLTPSVASLKLTKENTDLEVICMARPRAAGFCYLEIEYTQLFNEAKQLLENGADGIAFGFLLADHTIDVARTKEMVGLIKSFNKKAVFHRAYDCVVNPIESIETLIDCGIDRVLTSGLQPTAIEGKEVIKMLQENYATQIEILPGSGVNASNVKELVAFTAVNQIHSSCKDFLTDITTSGKSVNYSYAGKEHINDYEVVNRKIAEGLKEVYDKK